MMRIMEMKRRKRSLKTVMMITKSKSSTNRMPSESMFLIRTI
jgi:hypothetical protein